MPWRFRNWPYVLAALPLIVVLAAHTRARLHDWKDDDAFVEAMLRHNPNGLLANLKASELSLQRKDFAEAERFAAAAAAIAPSHLGVHAQYAITLIAQQRPDEAVKYLEPKLHDPALIKANEWDRTLIAKAWLHYGGALIGVRELSKAFFALCNAMRSEPAQEDLKHAGKLIGPLNRVLHPENPALIDCSQKES